MNCFSELDYSIYVDGEASAQQARLIETHADECARCRVLLDVLRSENLLFSLLLGTEPVEPAAEFVSSRAAAWWGVAALALIAIAWQAATSWLQTIELPPALAWLNPFRADFWWSVASGTVFSIDFPAPNTALLAAVAGLVLLGILGLGGWVFRRSLPQAALPVMSLLLIFAMLSPANALERRKGTTVSVTRGDTVNDTLLVMAKQDANIDGTIAGDLIVFGKRVSIGGSVKGDVICFARSVEVNGKVDGNIYNFAQTLRIEGEAARSITAFTRSMELPAQGRVGADLVTFAEEANLEGSVGRDVMTFTETTSVRGKIGRNFSARSNRVTLTAPATVAGDFSARVRKKERVEIGEGVVISGKTDIEVRAKRNRYARPGFYIWQAVTLVGAWIVGMLLAALFPAAFAFTPKSGSEFAWRTAVGFLVLLATPIAALLLAITLVGLPLGLIALGLWVLILYFAKIFVAATVAQQVFKPAGTTARAMAVPLLASLLIVWIAINLPFVGGIISFIVMLVGAGIVFLWWRARLWPITAQPLTTA
jgi:cytoskeletal protein CcmA (bactofilin family)